MTLITYYKINDYVNAFYKHFIPLLSNKQMK